MDVVALVPARNHPSTRYRIAQFADHLQAAGLNLRFETIAGRLDQRVRQLMRPRRQQIVVLQRKLLPVWQQLLLRQSTGYLVYDFDDAVDIRDSLHPLGPHSLTRRVRFATAVNLADRVLAGNSYLADRAKRFTTGRKIHVVPTCVDATRYEPAIHNEHMPTRLVWIGSKSTVQMLIAARPLLEAIGEAIPRVVLRVICDRFPKFDRLAVEPAPWSSETEMGDLSTSDIGISWIPDDPWSRGKCGLKVLQYMASGLPVVASPVGVHEQMLAGGSGFLAREAQEWVDGVRELSRNASLRAEMGREGRDRQRRLFHTDTWGPVLAEHLAEAARTL